MKIYFSDRFKNELKTFGSYIKLSTCRLGNYNITGDYNIEDIINNPSSEYIDFKSLWYQETKSLNITLDLSEYPNLKEDELIENDYRRTAIYFYYSDINDTLIDLAFVIWGDGDKLNLCSNSERHDLNYITVHFPKNTVANIETVHDEEFLESSSNIVGINTFLAVDGEYNSDDYITKDSYYKFIRNKISVNNYDPLFLNSSGEKVYSITSYKHYKSIEIKSNLTGRTLDNGDISYYTAGNSTINILGTCTYDLYEVSNNDYKLKKSNCTEDISSATLYQILGEDSFTDIGQDCEINQTNKTIEFKNRSDSEKTSFKASISFISEIGSTSGSIVTIDSNILNFTTYLSWTVDYSTNLSQEDDKGKSHALLLFDNTAENSGWEIEGNNNAGKIVISSESELRNPESDITISSEDPTVFNEYFDFTISEGVYDSTNRNWKYTIDIKTKKECSGKDWFPLDSEGSSKLVLNTIKIENAEKSSSDVMFYCVQRTKYPLELRRFQGGSWSNALTSISFDGTMGVKSLNDIYICNPVGEYQYWEVISDDVDFGLNQASNKLADTLTKPTNISSSTLYTKATPGYSVKTLGNLVIRRNNRNNSYDKTNWKDLIYCSTDNDIKVSVSIKGNSSYTTTNRVDSGTEYYYENSKLYLFSRYSGDAQVFEIIKSGTSDNEEEEIPDLEIEYDNKELFERYFDIAIEKKRRSEFLFEEEIFIYNKNLIYDKEHSIITPKARIVSGPTLIDSSFNKFNVLDPSHGIVGGKIESVKLNDKLFYTDSSLAVSNINIIDNGRKNNGLVGYLPGHSLKEEEIINKLYNVIVYTVSITPKIIESSESKIDWFPKRTVDGKVIPIGVKIGDEKFYCIIKPDFSDTIRFYDSKELKEISSIKFLNSDGYIDGNFTKRKYLYVGTNSDSSEFNYWYVYKKDPEVSIKCDAHGYGSIKKFQLISGDPSTWDGTQQTTIIDTSSLATTTEDYSFDPVIIKRSTFRYDSLLDMYGDWKMQLVEDYEFNLSIESEGKEPSKNIELMQVDSDGNFIDLEDDGLFELDRLGIYKLYIKSENKFRVVLSGNEDNFYFFDIDKNSIKENILMQDEGRFDDIIGREICFAFLGKEDKNFESKDQILKTTITVINLDDNSSKVLHLHRKYFNKLDETTGTLSIPVIDSLIVPSSTSPKNIFFKDSGLSSDIEFQSFLETYVNFEKKNEEIGDVVLGKEIVNLNYGTYSSKGTLGAISFLSRGYLDTTTTIEAKNLLCPDTNYPIHPSGILTLRHKNNFNNRAVSYNIYKLIPAPELILDRNSVNIPFPGNRNAIIQMKLPESGDYVVEALDEEHNWVEIPLIEDGEGITTKINIGGYLISKYNLGVSNPGWISFIVEGPSEDFEGENTINVGSLRFRQFVDKDHFIYNEKEVLNKEYSQEEVNELAGYSSKVIPINRLSKSDSASSVTGDFTSLISKLGENREFTLDKLDADSSVTIKKESYFNDPIISGKTITIPYISRLNRFGYSLTTNLSYAASNSQTLSTNSLNYVRNFSTNTETTDKDTGSNFTLTVGEEEPIITSGLKQETWTTGIRFCKNYYNVNGMTNLIMGKNNTMTITLSSSGGMLDYYLDTVNLPNENRDMFSVLTKPAIKSHSSGLSITYNDTTYNNPQVPRFNLKISVPENENVSNSLQFSIELDDGRGDFEHSLTLNIVVNSKSDFNIYAFENYDNTDGLYSFTNSNILKDLSMSPSGSARSGKTVYVLTDAPSEYCSFYLYTNTYSSSVYTYDNKSAFDKISSCSISSRITGSRYLGKGVYSGNEYSVYELSLYSKLDSIYLKSNMDIESCIGYVPFYCTNCYLGFSSSIYGTTDRFTLRYGTCNVSLEGPYNTYLSVQSWGTESSREEIKKIANFQETINATESTKYTSGTNPSYFKSNKKIGSSSYSSSTVKFDNNIWISYLDNTPLKYPIKFFSPYGYYCGFKLFVERKEWEYTDGNWEIITFNNHVINGLGEAKLLMQQGVREVIYTDYLEPAENVSSHTRSSNNPMYIDAQVYHGSSEYYMVGSTIYGTKSGEVIFPNSSVGSVEGAVVFDISSEKFTTSGDTKSCYRFLNTYEVDDSGITISDMVNFRINISLILKDE